MKSILVLIAALVGQTNGWKLASESLGLRPVDAAPSVVAPRVDQWLSVLGYKPSQPVLCLSKKRGDRRTWKVSGVPCRMEVDSVSAQLLNFVRSEPLPEMADAVWMCRTKTEAVAYGRKVLLQLGMPAYATISSVEWRGDDAARTAAEVAAKRMVVLDFEWVPTGHRYAAACSGSHISFDASTGKVTYVVQYWNRAIDSNEVKTSEGEARKKALAVWRVENPSATNVVSEAGLAYVLPNGLYGSPNYFFDAVWRIRLAWRCRIAKDWVFIDAASGEPLGGFTGQADHL